MDHLKVGERPIDIWRDKIKSCKFDCWDCNYCESVVESHLKKNKEEFKIDSHVDRVINSIDKAIQKTSNFVSDGYPIRGLTSDRVRHFLNNLCSDPSTVYLEMGTLMGSTFFAATMNNNIRCFGVDDFSDPECKPMMDHANWAEVGNAFEEFQKNWSTLKHLSEFLYGNYKSSDLSYEEILINSN
jgi:hypothetical protein